MKPDLSPHAGKQLPKELLTDIPKLLAAYTDKPDAADPGQRVSFGTSGHRGTSTARTFNEDHILAVTQAVCDYRKSAGINGPLFVGYDTHALSEPAFRTCLEVLAANGAEARVAPAGEYTPTPAVSHAILNCNRGRKAGLADGVVITPSHNPPSDGGFKYNPPSGGPADVAMTSAIQDRANALLAAGLAGVKRTPFEKALKASTTRVHDFRRAYVAGLADVLDFKAIKAAGLKLGADPLGGSGVKYWGEIAAHYGLDLDVVSEAVDPSFSFMTADWDGKIRMDPSSQYAMRRLIGLKDKYEVAFGCDPDYDRHGIVTRTGGLMQPNHYLAVAIDYLFRNRPAWRRDAAVGKTMVSSSMIDKVAAGLGRGLREVPVGFKWFVDGLLDGSFGFGGEESAGASFLRFDGGAWSTDKDGLILALLSAEITARTGKNPSQYYEDLVSKYGRPYYARQDAPCTPEMKKLLKGLTAEKLPAKDLAGDPIEAVLNKAPSNGEALGGVKVASRSGWFAARPSGTENVYKIYAESWRDEAHLRKIFEEAAGMIAKLAA